MLDPRLYRAALVPLLLAVIVCAFSLQNRPEAVQTTLPPDAFDARGAMARLTDLGDRFADRRPGGGDDEALAAEVAARFRELSGPRRADGLDAFPVRVERFRADTIDGPRELTTVIARRAGAPGPGLVVVAHRDAAARGSRAELSGTAALLELARVASEVQLRRTITFVSTSGGSGGSAGARTLARQLAGDPAGAVLVLGDMAGERVRKPFVVPWGNGRSQAPLRLTRSVEAAVRTEAGVDPGAARASAQAARLALPGTVGEQGPLVDAGLPAVLLSVSGERGPRPGERVLEERMGAFGRSALRAILALDAGPAITAPPTADLVTLRKVLPAWAIRLLVGALLLPLLLVGIDGLARAGRRGERVGAALAWLGRAALPVLAALVAARLLHLVGVLPSPPSPLPAAGVQTGGQESAAMAVLVLVAVLVLLVARPHGRFAGPGAGVVLVVVLTLVAAAVWVASPVAALVLVLPAHLWLLLAAVPDLRIRRPVALLLVVAGLLPAVLVGLVRMRQLGVPVGDLPAFALALAAGGHIGPLSWPVWSLLAACAAAALALAWRLPGRPPDPVTTGAVTSRGPVGYAGPGSLGGTASALRR